MGAAAVALDLRKCGLDAERWAARTLRGHGLDHVCHGHDARFEQDLAAFGDFVASMLPRNAMAAPSTMALQMARNNALLGRQCAKKCRLTSSALVLGPGNFLAQGACINRISPEGEMSVTLETALHVLRRQDPSFPINKR